MESKMTRDEIERIVLQTIMARPYKEFDGCRVYHLKAAGEEEVIKGLKGTQTVDSLTELEAAVNSPEVMQIHIGKFASITSKGLKQVLSRTSLTKEIFCAFPIKD